MAEDTLSNDILDSDISMAQEKLTILSDKSSSGDVPNTDS